MQCPFCNYKNIEGEASCVSCGEDLTAFDRNPPKKVRDSIEKRLTKECVIDLARCEVSVFDPEVPVQKVAETLQGKNRYGLIVEGGQLVGVVTVRDILQKAIFRDLDLDKTPIRELMTANPESLQVQDKLVHVLNKMSIGGYRHIPILEDGQIRAAVSAHDVLSYIAELFAEELEPAV